MNKETRIPLLGMDMQELKEVAGGASGSSQSEECNRHIDDTFRVIAISRALTPLL